MAYYPDFFLYLAEDRVFSIVAKVFLSSPSLTALGYLTHQLYFSFQNDNPYEFFVTYAFYLWWLILPILRRLSLVLKYTSGSNSLLDLWRHIYKAIKFD